jgi:hypothetical protein
MSLLEDLTIRQNSIIKVLVMDNHYESPFNAKYGMDSNEMQDILLKLIRKLHVKYNHSSKHVYNYRQMRKEIKQDRDMNKKISVYCDNLIDSKLHSNDYGNKKLVQIFDRSEKGVNNFKSRMYYDDIYISNQKIIDYNGVTINFVEEVRGTGEDKKSLNYISMECVSSKDNKKTLEYVIKNLNQILNS